MPNPALIQRLKERRLVQWAIAYLAGAWVTLLLPLGIGVAISSCGEPHTPPPAGPYRVEVLAHDIDSTTVPHRFAADFDGDGKIDRVTETERFQCPRCLPAA